MATRKSPKKKMDNEGFINSLIKVESAHVLLFTGVLASLVLFWQVKSFFMTREEGVAVEKRVDSMEISIKDISSDIKNLSTSQDNKISNLRLEIKNDIIESNKLVLSRMSEITDRLIARMEQIDEANKLRSKRK